MWDKIKNAFSAPSLAAIRNVLSALAGVAAAAGLISMTKAQPLIDAIMGVGTALAALVTAVSALVMVIAPLIAAFKATQPQQVKSVASQPNTLVVNTASSSGTVDIANAVATMPQVTQVVATPAIAQATPSEKVVAK